MDIPRRYSTCTKCGSMKVKVKVPCNKVPERWTLGDMSQIICECGHTCYILPSNLEKFYVYKIKEGVCN